MDVNDATKLRALEGESPLLKHLVVDLTLDNQMLKGIGGWLAMLTAPGGEAHTFAHDGSLPVREYEAPEP